MMCEAIKEEMANIGCLRDEVRPNSQVFQ